MKVTVITVCLNAAATLAKTIESVLHAGPSVCEYLVIDGGSTDGTLEVIQHYEPRFQGRLRWISESDEGLYHAMNRGMEMAQGSLVLFLGADDLVLPGALDRAAELIDADEEIDLVYGDVRVLESDGTTRIEHGCEVSGLVGGIPRAMPACHQASMFSLEALRRLGGFDTSFEIAADYELYLRFVEAGLKSRYIPVVIAEFSLSGVSATQGAATADEYRRAWVKHGVHPAVARARMLRSLFNLTVARFAHRLSSSSEAS